MTRKGKIVETKTGKLGICYNYEKMINGRVPVYLINEQGKKTGLNMMCDAATLTIKGHTD